MSVLPDKIIQERIKSGDLMITPFEKKNLGPASVDLVLSPFILVFNAESQRTIDIKDPTSFADLHRLLAIPEGIKLDPGMFVLGSTHEQVKVPKDCLAQVQGRSSLSRLGIFVHVSAPNVHPGHDGSITLEIKNVGPLPVVLYPYMRICQISFLTMTDIPTNVKDSKYRTQKGPTASEIWKEFKK